ncbi:hypothetical protein C8R44DRAFT_873567 [Mycena epipterygia]|nr:hypothetical protein C8R44DRAFT_873567 [Mycena epipterygia]
MQVPVLFARKRCLVCDCSGTTYDSLFRNIPRVPTEECLCGHPLHSHLPSKRERDHVLALHPRAVAGGLAAVHCAAFFSLQVEWAFRTSCICHSPWFAHDRIDDPSSPAPSQPDPRVPLPAPSPFSSTSHTTPSTTFITATEVAARNQQVVTRSTPIAVFQNAGPGHGSPPIATFERPGPDLRSPPERRAVSIANHLTPETRLPDTVAIRGKKGRRQTSSRKVSSSNAAGNSSNLFASQVPVPAQPVKPVTFTVCLLPFQYPTLGGDDDDPVVAYAGSADAFPGFFRHLQRQNLTLVITFRGSNLWKDVDQDVRAHAHSHGLVLIKPRGYSDQSFDHHGWRLVAPANASRNNGTAIRAWTLVSIREYEFEVSHITKIGQRIQGIDDCPVLLLVPTEAHLEGPLYPGGPPHRCFPWTSLRGTALMQDDPPSCEELRCAPAVLVAAAASRTSRPRTPSLDEPEQRRPARRLRTLSPEDPDPPTMAEVLAVSAATADNPSHAHLDLRRFPVLPVPRLIAPPRSPDGRRTRPPGSSPYMQAMPRQPTDAAISVSSLDSDDEEIEVVADSRVDDTEDMDIDLDIDLAPLPPTPTPAPTAAIPSRPNVPAADGIAERSVAPPPAAPAVALRAPAAARIADRSVAPPPAAAAQHMMPPFLPSQAIIQPPPPQEVLRASAAQVTAYIRHQPRTHNLQSLDAPTPELLATVLLTFLRSRSGINSPSDPMQYAVPRNVKCTLRDVSHLQTRYLKVHMQVFSVLCRTSPSLTPLPHRGPATGRGPIRAVFTAGLQEIVGDPLRWGARGPYFMPVWSAPNLRIPSRLTAYWAAGRWAALSIMHRDGLGPDPISPFLLILAILGFEDGLELQYHLIAALDPAAAETLLPWLVLDHNSVVPPGSVASSRVGQLLLEREITAELSIMSRKRRLGEHRSIGRSLFASVLLGLPEYEHHYELHAFVDGFRGAQTPDAIESFKESSSAKPLELIAKMYDCRVRSVDEILARLVWVTTDDPDPHADAFFGLFEIRFIRYLCGDPLTRARLFLFAMVESFAIPLAPDFQFTILLTRGNTPQPPHFHSCSVTCDIQIDPYLENALKEPCDLDDPEDATLFDEWLHLILLAKPSYNRI